MDYPSQSRCKQPINREPCFARDALEQRQRGAVHPSHNVADRRLSNAHATRKLGLCQAVLLHPRPKSFHAVRVSNWSIENAIDHFYVWAGDAARMKRSFYDRAMEALRERYPRQKPTQELLAGLAGVKQPTVVAWRTGYPTMETAVRLAVALDVCVEWLLTGRGPKRPGKPEVRDMDQLEPTWAELTTQQKTEVARYADYLHEQGKGKGNVGRSVAK